MRVLGIDTSGLVASVAILTDDILTGEYTTNYKKTHSQTLLPMLNELMNRLEMDINNVDAIAVAAGPGSFTGLRIGSSTAKGLGLALNKPIISVPTLEGLAYNLCDTQGLICPIMDAKRNQVYTGIYEVMNAKLETIMPQAAISIDELIAQINKYQRKVIFLGDGVEVYKEQIIQKVDAPFQFAPAHLAKQRAGTIAALGKLYYEQGRYESASDHTPVYLRMSQAERERLEREKEK